MGKGSKRRPSQISQREQALRHELCFGKVSDSRKLEIKQELERLNGKENVLSDNKTQ